MINKKLIMEAINSGLTLEQLKKNIEDDIYEIKDYEALTRNFVGSKIKDYYCNGFFGSGEYNLDGAHIYRVEDGITEIFLTVVKTSGEFKTAIFNHGADWEIVYRYLVEWTKEEDF